MSITKLYTLKVRKNASDTPLILKFVNEAVARDTRMVLQSHDRFIVEGPEYPETLYRNREDAISTARSFFS